MRRNGQQVLATDQGVEGVLPVSGTTVYSDRFRLENVVKIGLDLTASGSTIDILVILVISHADSADDTDYKTEDGYSDIVNLTTTTRSLKTVHDSSIPAAKWGRIRFTGQGSNAANAAVTGILNIVRDEGV